MNPPVAFVPPKEVGRGDAVQLGTPEVVDVRIPLVVRGVTLERALVPLPNKIAFVANVAFPVPPKPTLSGPPARANVNAPALANDKPVDPPVILKAFPA